MVTIIVVKVCLLLSRLCLLSTPLIRDLNDSHAPILVSKYHLCAKRCFEVPEQPIAFLKAYLWLLSHFPLCPSWNCPNVYLFWDEIHAVPVPLIFRPCACLEHLCVLPGHLCRLYLAVPKSCLENSPKNGSKARSLLDFLGFESGINTILIVLLMRKAVSALIVFNWSWLTRKQVSLSSWHVLTLVITCSVGKST